MPHWIKAGLLYGLAGFALAVALAAARALVLEPLVGRDAALTVEFVVFAAALVAVGLGLMPRFGPWTTNSSLAYGMVGAGLVFAVDAPIGALVSGAGVQDWMTTAALTHGTLFPVALAVMAIGPSFLTARA